jgi:predicted Zn-dependent protease
MGQGLLLGGALVGQILGLPAQDILNLGSMAAQLIFLRYSREDELEADQLSVEYGSAAGYDPREAIAFFQTLDRIQEKEGQEMPNFLSTHPNPGDRIQRIRELTGTSREKRAAPTDARYLATVEGLVLGEDPRQGFVEGSMFYHPDLRFRFPVPRGFKLINQPSQVVMVENQNRALLGFSGSREKSLDAAVASFLKQGALRVLDRSATRSNGLPAYVVVADAQMQNGQVARIIAYFVQYGGNIFHFVGYTAPQTFNSFRNVFLQTMQGFGPVEDPRILNRQPVRTALSSVKRAVSFREAIPRSLPVPFTADEVAIMNQVELTERIEPGRTVKIPVAR